MGTSKSVSALVLGHERVKQQEEIPPCWRALQRPCKHLVQQELQSRTVPPRRYVKMYYVRKERVVSFFSVLKLTTSQTFWMGDDDCVWRRERWADLQCSVWTAGERCTHSITLSITPAHPHLPLLTDSVSPKDVAHTLAPGCHRCGNIWQLLTPFFHTEWKHRQWATVCFLCFGPLSLCCFF